MNMKTDSSADEELAGENKKWRCNMAGQRKSIDCRNYPSEKNCSLKISGTEEEVLDAAVQHAVSAHGHENSPELRDQIKSMLKDESD
jgi:predicted small metal-binding protein